MIVECSKCGRAYEEISEEVAVSPDRFCDLCYIGDAIGFVVIDEANKPPLTPEQSESLRRMLEGRKVSGPVELPLTAGERLAPGALDLSGLISEEQAREVLASYDAGSFVHADMLRAACLKTGRPVPEAPSVEKISGLLRADAAPGSAMPSLGAPVSFEGRVVGEVVEVGVGGSFSARIDDPEVFDRVKRRTIGFSVSGTAALLDEAEIWIRAVDVSIENGGEVPIPPVPIDALADRIRSDGRLEELPALALLDEIAGLRRKLKVFEDVEQALAFGVLDDSAATLALIDAGFPLLAESLAFASSRGYGLGPEEPLLLDGREVGKRRSILGGDLAGGWICTFGDDLSREDRERAEEALLAEQAAGVGLAAPAPSGGEPGGLDLAIVFDAARDVVRLSEPGEIREGEEVLDGEKLV